MRFSENGIATIDSDDKLNIQVRFDEEENYSYLTLGMDESLENKFSAIKRRIGRAYTWITLLLYSESWIGMLLIPLFIYHILLFYLFSLDNANIYAYFETLKSSKFLSISSLVFGAAALSVLIFRNVLIEFGTYFRKVRPGHLSRYINFIERAVTANKRQVGLAFFMFMFFLEIFIKAIMSVSTLVYGVSNVINLQLMQASVNFGQSILLVVSNIPIIGRTIKYFLGPNQYTSVIVSDTFANFLGSLVWFVFSTMILGLAGRIFAMVRSEKEKRSIVNVEDFS